MSNSQNKTYYDVIPKTGDIYYIKQCNGKAMQVTWYDQLVNFIDWDTRQLFKTKEACLKSKCPNGGR